MRTQYVITNTAARGRMDEVNLSRRYLGNDAYMAHNPPTNTVSLETNDIAWACMRDGNVYPSVVIQRRTRGRADTQGGVIAIPNETTAIETGRGFPAAAVMGP